MLIAIFTDVARTDYLAPLLKCSLQDLCTRFIYAKH